MEDMKALFDATVFIFSTEFTIFGFTMSWWDIFLWTGVAGLIFVFIGGFFDG